MNTISSIPSYIISELLTPSQKSTLSFLPKGVLQNIIISQLIVEDDVLSIKIAQIVLNILENCPQQHSQVINSFLVDVLQETTTKTQITLNKISKIIENGFFDDFFLGLSNPKKESLASDILYQRVDQFYVKKLPLLIKKKQLELSEQKEKESSAITLMQNYQQIQSCQSYCHLPKILESYLNLFKNSQEWIKEIFKHLIKQLNTDYQLKFKESEKLELVKLISQIFVFFSTYTIICYSTEDLDEFLVKTCQLKNSSGEEFLGYFFKSLKRQNNCSLFEIIKILNFLNLISKENTFYKFLDEWQQTSFDWNFLFSLLEKEMIQKEVISDFLTEDITRRLERFKDDPTVTVPIKAHEINLLNNYYQIVINFCKTYQQLSFNELITIAHEIRNKALKNSITEEDKLCLLALGCLALKIQFYAPYSTQILAALSLLIGDNSRQAQVKTGEGKSFIIALWIFVTAMQCRAVDVITSSRYLASRDQAKFNDFFKRCGISTSHICYEDKKSNHFQAQVLYGPAVDFEFAWMSDRISGGKLFEARLSTPYISRNFDCVCIDESDNLLIDSASNQAISSYPSDTSVEWIYAPILFFVKDLVEQKNYSLIQLIININLLKEYLKKYLSEDHKKKCQALPEEQLVNWLKCAFHALVELKENHHYVIKKQKNESGQNKSEIQIIDVQTGRISEDSRWGNGVHEFLEIKHDIKVKKENLTPLSISHAIFYKFYLKISALTGTAERNQTQSIYEIESFDIPSHFPLKRQDAPPIITTTAEEYFSCILALIKQCVSSKRPVLVLCETIKESEYLAQLICKQQLKCQLLNETQEALEHLVIKQAGQSGKITVATNVAGRGTDIVLAEESLKNGGLQVLLTFYPDSERVENQAIGRAGRQGQVGSSQMIIHKQMEKIKTLIGNQLDFLSNEKLLILLNQFRKTKETQQAKLVLSKLKFERFHADLTSQFFENFRMWSEQVENDEFLERISNKLCLIKLNPKKIIDFNSLAEADLVIAKEFKNLLLVPKTEMLDWKVFLQSLSKRISHQILTNWSIHFFKPTHQELNKLNNNSMSNPVIIYEKIKNTLKENQDKWDKYLNKNGLGLFIYLKEITSIDISIK
jgi:preprotein translocase subunit SecA